MSLLATGSLARAMREIPNGDPAKILGVMNSSIKYVLGQDSASGESDDGMDMGICRILPAERRVDFAGARFSLFVASGTDVREVKGDKYSVGYRSVPLNKTYTNIAVPLAPGDRVYMTTDGLTDQVGGPNRRMFGKRRFRELLAELADRTMKDQKKEILTAFRDFQGQENRRDDLSLIGFRLD